MKHVFAHHADVPADASGATDARATRVSSGRHMRAWAWAGSILLVLIVAFGLCEWQGWPFLKGPIASQLTEHLHHEVVLGDRFKINLLGGLRIRSDALTVRQPRWMAEATPMVDAQDVDLKLTYGGLLRFASDRNPEDLRVAHLEVARLDAALARTADGRANWVLDESGRAPPKQGEQPTTLPRVDKLLVKNGRIVLNDDVLKFDLDATIHTSEGQAAAAANSADSGLRIQGNGHYHGNPFDLKITSPGALPLITEPKKAPPVPVTIHAQAGKSKVSFDGVSKDVLNLESIDGVLKLSGPSLAAIGDAVGVTLPTTAPFSLDGHLNKDGDVWGLDVKALSVGSSHLSGQFKFDRRPKVPVLTGQLNGTQFALVDLAPAFGAPVHGSPNPKPPSGLVLPQKEFDVPSLKMMNADVKLRLQRVTLGALFAQPLEPLDADLSLQSGVLKISNILASTAGGKLRGDLRLDGAGGTHLKWDTDLQWADIELSHWLNAKDTHINTDQQGKPTDQKQKTEARAEGQKAATSYVSGDLAGRAKLHGEGNSTAKLLGSLNGTVDTWVRNGHVSHMVAEGVSLHVLEALGLYLTGDSQQPMNCAVAHLSAQNGVVRPEVALVDTPQTTVWISGGVSLADEKLDLTLTSKPKDFSLISLRTPIDVKGSFADPHVALHANPLGVKVLAAAAMTVLAPLAAIVPLVDVGKDHDSGCAAALQLLKSSPTHPPAGTAPQTPPPHGPHR